MSRYIDIETIKPRQYENSEVELGVLAYDYDEVDAMPFLDIVRCKECKFIRIYDGETKYYYCALEDRPNRQWSVDETDYCSWGEHKEKCKECWYWSEVHKHCENKCGCQFKPYGERK